MSKLSLVAFNLIGLIIHHISCFNVPTSQEQFRPEKQTGIFDPLYPVDLYLNFEKSSRKGYTGSKKQFEID